MSSLEMDVNATLSSMSARLPQAKGKKDEELMKAAKEFESLFMNMVMKEMRSTVPDSELMGNTSNVKFFQSMLDEEYSKLSANTKASGLADMIYRQMSRGMNAELETEQASKPETEKGNEP